MVTVKDEVHTMGHYERKGVEEEWTEGLSTKELYTTAMEALTLRPCPLSGAGPCPQQPQIGRKVENNEVALCSFFCGWTKTLHLSS